MVYLLDTNACIQLWQRKNLIVRNHFARRTPSEIVLCSVVKAELLFGAMRSAFKQQNAQLLRQLFEPLNSFEFDDHCAEHYAEIRADLTQSGLLIGANDLLIAAIARANKATLVTNNTREFQRVSGLLLDDWEVEWLS